MSGTSREEIVTIEGIGDLVICSQCLQAGDDRSWKLWVKDRPAIWEAHRLYREALKRLVQQIPLLWHVPTVGEQQQPVRPHVLATAEAMMATYQDDLAYLHEQGDGPWNDGSHPCIINNPYCTPGPCANCGRVFCAHEHPEKRAFGYYGQFCTDACRDAKYRQVWETGGDPYLVVSARTGQTSHGYLGRFRRGNQPGCNP